MTEVATRRIARGEQPLARLRGFRGVLQMGAYSGFAALFGSAVLEASCWANARRKFYDLHVAQRSPLAAEARQRIGVLYANERAIRGRCSAERAQVRQAQAGPPLAALYDWLTATLPMVSAKSELAGAIRYAPVRWGSLTRCRDDGRLEIDNNSAERSIRPLVLGRRNYLFASSDAGGERAANLYSLIGSTLLNGLDPYLDLRHVLERIAEQPSRGAAAVERRRRRTHRIDTSRVAPAVIGPANPVTPPAAASSELANLAAIVDGGGQVMLGTIAPIRGAAVAHDGKKTLAMLQRRPGELITALLVRLDGAVATARASGVRVDEINTPGANRRYKL